nr:sigma-70 family RNA polymerase sigma factor [Kibdelosporangium sp. MJ126-NF4]
MQHGDDLSGPSIPPEQLLLAVGSGDRRCFAALYQRLAPSVLGLAHVVVRDRAQAEEVAHEVFAELWRTAPRFCPDQGTATTWVMTLAHRLAVDRVRSARNSAQRDQVTGAHDDTTPFDQASESEMENSERQRIHECVRTLSRCHREALILTYYGGLTYEEVAHALDVPPGTVKGRIRSALEQLRLHMSIGG